MIDMDIRTKIIQSELYEILPFVKSMYTKKRYMLLSYESIIHAEKKLDEKMRAIRDEKERELSEKGSTAWGEKDFARWNVNIEGFDVDIFDYVGKNMWDFFHYSRTCLDEILQILNVVAFDPESRKKKEDVYQSIIRDLPAEFEQVKIMLRNLENDKQYIYLSDVDNYLKHIDEIGIDMKTNGIMLDEFEAFIIREFVYRGIKYERKAIAEAAGEVKDFVVNTLDSFLNILLSDIHVTRRRNQITDIGYEQLMDGNVLRQLTFYIDVPETANDIYDAFGSEIIFVRPLRVDKDYHIYEDTNFKFDTIFIRQENTGNIIGKACLAGDESDAFFKKYIVQPSNSDELKNYLFHFRENYKKIRISNVLAFRGIEKRIAHN